MFSQEALTWSTPHWGWRRSCCRPQSCWSVCSDCPRHWPTGRRWSSWWRWCFCPAGCTSLFQSETNTRQQEETDTVLLWNRVHRPHSESEGSGDLGWLTGGWGGNCNSSPNQELDFIAFIKPDFLCVFLCMYFFYVFLPHLCFILYIFIQSQRAKCTKSYYFG